MAKRLIDVPDDLYKRMVADYAAPATDKDVVTACVDQMLLVKAFVQSKPFEGSTTGYTEYGQDGKLYAVQVTRSEIPKDFIHFDHSVFHKIPAEQTEDDLISRTDLINDITERYTLDRDLISIIETAPRIEPNKLLAYSRPYGEWIHTNDCDEEFQYRCSRCGLPMQSNSHRYCPNCGAAMILKGNDAE